MILKPDKLISFKGVESYSAGRRLKLILIESQSILNKIVRSSSRQWTGSTSISMVHILFYEMFNKLHPVIQCESVKGNNFNISIF